MYGADQFRSARAPRLAASPRAMGGLARSPSRRAPARAALQLGVPARSEPDGQPAAGRACRELGRHARARYIAKQVALARPAGGALRRPIWLFRPSSRRSRPAGSRRQADTEGTASAGAHRLVELHTCVDPSPHRVARPPTVFGPDRLAAGATRSGRRHVCHDGSDAPVPRGGLGDAAVGAMCPKTRPAGGRLSPRSDERKRRRLGRPIRLPCAGPRGRRMHAMGETPAETDIDKREHAPAHGPGGPERGEAPAGDDVRCGVGSRLSRGVSGGSSKLEATQIHGFRSPTNAHSWPGTGRRSR